MWKFGNLVKYIAQESNAVQIRFFEALGITNILVRECVPRRLHGLGGPVTPFAGRAPLRPAMQIFQNLLSSKTLRAKNRPPLRTTLAADSSDGCAEPEHSGREFWRLNRPPGLWH